MVECVFADKSSFFTFKLKNNTHKKPLFYIMSTLRPRKRFGQHFLQDPSVIENIIHAIVSNLPANCQLVEIGPGKGALTIPLLKQVDSLFVIELDRDLVDYLQQQVISDKLHIYQADALDFDFKKCLLNHDSLQIIGNLPYNISTPLLFHLLNYAANIEKMVFMLQKEVVERMIAEPNSSAYGRLSVMLQYHCEIVKLFDVPATAFNPPPKVESSIVVLLPYRTPPVPVDSLKDLATIVSHAFSQRRKTLRNSLKNVMTAEAMQNLQIDPQARAETLPLSDFVHLANCYSQSKITS